ncbi:MAG TPA: hypothetical protein VFZ64_14805 [Nocardioidaceae bacterium]
MKRLVVGLLALAVGSALWVGWSWRTHPDTFRGFGNGMISTREVGQPLHVGMTWEGVDIEPRKVTLHDAEAHVVKDTADAEISFSLCRAADEPVGSAGGALERWCSEVRPIHDTSMTLNADPRETVVMTVRPTQPGIVRVRGIDLTYTDGWRTGTEHTGSVVVVRVPAR